MNLETGKEKNIVILKKLYLKENILMDKEVEKVRNIMDLEKKF